MTDFASFCVVSKLPELQAAADATETRLRAEGNVIAADRVLRAYIALRDGLIALAARLSARGTETLKRQEEESRVRPDTLGQGGPRLEDYLTVEPLLAIPGSIGIANETLLDAHVPWWVTNEVGSSARVGDKLFGVFTGPGQEEARPDGGERGVHPIFEPRSSGEFRGSGIIENPIPARYFVRDAVAVIQAEWHAGFGALVGDYIAEVSLP
jgi:hypothetical protein